jgi:hypothetical protein
MVTRRSLELVPTPLVKGLTASVLRRKQFLGTLKSCFVVWSLKASVEAWSLIEIWQDFYTSAVSGSE